MTKQALPKSTLRTLGNLASYYEMDIDTLMSWVDANGDLAEEIKGYTKKCKLKGQKVLPPNVIDKMLLMFGRP